MNDAGNTIRFVSGDVRINCEGTVAVGIGSVRGGCKADLDDCVVSVLTNSANSVGIGAYEGSAQVSITNFRCFIDLSGSNLCGIGVLNTGSGSVEITSGSIFGDFHGRDIRCIGTEGGDLDIDLSYTDIKIEGGGSNIVGIGDNSGSGNVDIRCSKLDMLLLSKDSTGIASGSGTVNMTETIDAIKTSE